MHAALDFLQRWLSEDEYSDSLSESRWDGVGRRRRIRCSNILLNQWASALRFVWRNCCRVIYNIKELSSHAPFWAWVRCQPLKACRLSFLAFGLSLSLSYRPRLLAFFYSTIETDAEVFWGVCLDALALRKVRQSDDILFHWRLFVLTSCRLIIFADQHVLTIKIIIPVRHGVSLR